MKKTILIFASVLLSIVAGAQTVNLHLKNGNVVKYELSALDHIDFTSAGAVTPEAYKECPDANHPHWIDLGLPSGTQWHCCNEGASAPEVIGDYYTFEQVYSAPTLDQIKEFLNNTTSVWTTQNGVDGRKFTSKLNGASIFLPAAGFYLSTLGLVNVGMYAYYWSSTTHVSDPNKAYILGFNKGSAYWSDYNCIYGHSLRLVR